MNNIDETALINLVRNFPLLYDLSSPLYSDQQKKDEAWNEISILTSASAYDCKAKWTRLRDNYRKALILRKKTPDQAKSRAVKYEKELSFLKEKFSFTPRNKFKTAIENMESKSLDSQQDFQQQPKVKVLAIQETYTQNTESDCIPKKETTSKSMHEINSFFESIAETVKTLPRKMQVQLKRQIFTLVNDAEASLLDNQHNTSTIINYPAMPTISSPKITNSDYEEIGTSEANEISICNEYTSEQFSNVQIKQEINVNE